MLEGFAERIEQARNDAESISNAETIGPVIALNTVADLFLTHPNLRNAIRDGLNAEGQLGEHKGIWDIAYTGGGPVRRLDVQLFTSRGQVSMVDRSPLAEAVWLTEERRMKLAIFFFFENKDFSAAEETGSYGRLRGQVREQVITKLPRIALEAIEAYA
jgi:hypothetical protein